MLPFHLMSELSRTLALAVRLFGNVMSGAMLGAILLAVVPLFFPVVMQLLELLIGQIQAFIFAVLATVYIASANQAHAEKTQALLRGRSTRTGFPGKPEGGLSTMNASLIIGAVSIFTAGLTIAIGSICTALAQGQAISQAMSAIAQQPDEAATITRTLFVGSGDDRVLCHLLPGCGHDPDFRQPLLELRHRQGRRLSRC